MCIYVKCYATHAMAISIKMNENTCAIEKLNYSNIHKCVCALHIHEAAFNTEFIYL